MLPSLKRIKKMPDGPEFIETIMSYCYPAALENERQNMLQYTKEHLGNQEEEIAMTIGTALKREGRQEGLQEGLQKGEQAGIEKTALGMLKEGLALEMVKKITRLSKARLTQLLAKLEPRVAKTR